MQQSLSKQLTKQIRYELTTIIDIDGKNLHKFIKQQTMEQIKMQKDLSLYIIRKQYPYILYCGEDLRIVTILQSLSNILISFSKNQELQETIQHTYWKIKQIQYNNHYKDQLHFYLFNTAKKKKGLSELKFQSEIQVIDIVHKQMQVANLSVILYLFQKFKTLPDYQEDFYLDKINIFEILKLKQQSNQYKKLKNQIINEQYPFLKECKNKKSKEKLFRICRQLEGYNRIKNKKSNEHINEHRFNNIKEINIQNLELEQIKLGSDYMINIWLQKGLRRIKNLYNEIDNINDNNGIHRFRSLYITITQRLQELQKKCKDDKANLFKIKKIKKTIHQYYTYHQQTLNGHLKPLAKFYYHQFKYKITKRRIIIEKLLVVFMIIIVIQILTSNSLIMLTWGIVGGVFYMRQTK